MHFAGANVDPSRSTLTIVQTTSSSSNVEGMLYYNQISRTLVERLKIEVDAFSFDKAIQWQDNSGLHRQTFEFGISFKEIEEKGSIKRIEIPSFIVDVRNELVRCFEEHLSEKDPEKYENCILTVYSEGDGIKAHTDRDYFGPDVLGLIILPDCSTNPEKPPSTLNFFNPKSNERFRLLEKEGSAFLFQGLLRTQWKHELAPVATKRIAIQFRTVNEALIKK